MIPLLSIMAYLFKGSSLPLSSLVPIPSILLVVDKENIVMVIDKKYNSCDEEQMKW